MFENMKKIKRNIDIFSYISAYRVTRALVCNIPPWNLPAMLRFMLATSLMPLPLNEHWYDPASETLILWSLRVTLPSLMASFTNSVRFTYSGAASPLTPWPSLYRWTSLESSPLNQRTSIWSALRGGDNWQQSSACPPTAGTKCLVGMVTVQFSVEEDRKPGYMGGQQLLCCCTL